MPRVIHFPSSGDRWAFVVTSCPIDYFFKMCSDCSLGEQRNCPESDRERKRKKPQVTWEHGFLKQIKDASTRPTSASSPGMRSRDHRLGGSIVLSTWTWDTLLEDLIYFMRGFFRMYPMHVSPLRPCFSTKGTPHIWSQHSVPLYSTRGQRERHVEKFSRIRLYKQWQHKQGPEFLSPYWKAAFSGM